MKRQYDAETVKNLYFMFRNILGKKPIELRKTQLDREYKTLIDITALAGNIDEDLKITEVYTVNDLFDTYDKHVPVDRRLFWLAYDAEEFQGIFTIDELMKKLTKDGYFEHDFWCIHSSEEDAIKDFMEFKLNDATNIAYERL